MEYSLMPIMIKPEGRIAIEEAVGTETGVANFWMSAESARLHWEIAVTALVLHCEKSGSWSSMMDSPRKSGWVASKTVTPVSAVLMAVPQFHALGLSNQGLSRRGGFAAQHDDLVGAVVHTCIGGICLYDPQRIVLA